MLPYQNPIQMNTYNNRMTDISQQLQALQPQMSVTNQMQYVNNRQSAEAYQMQPNSSVVLWDSNSDKFYVKQSDASGFCTVREFKFEEVKSNSNRQNETEYATKSDIDDLKAQIEKIKEDYTNNAKDARNSNNNVKR